jgi:hypothetical protein
VFVWVALGAWVLTFAGLVWYIVRLLRAATAKATPVAEGQPEGGTPSVVDGRK